MRSYVWALIQYDWYTYKRRLEHLQAQMEDHKKTPEKDGHLQAKKRGPQKKPTCQTLILDFWPLELWGNKFMLFELPSRWYFIMTALGN